MNSESTTESTCKVSWSFHLLGDHSASLPSLRSLLILVQSFVEDLSLAWSCQVVLLESSRSKSSRLALTHLTLPSYWRLLLFVSLSPTANTTSHPQCSTHHVTMMWPWNGHSRYSRVILTCDTHNASTCFAMFPLNDAERMLNGLMAHSHGTHGTSTTSMWHCGYCGISSSCRRCASSFASLARRSVDQTSNCETCPGPSSGPSPAQLVVAAHSHFLRYFKCLESQSRHQALPTQKVQHKQFQWVTVSHFQLYQLQ